MHIVYILQSGKTKEIYIGFTTNLKSRLAFHNSGKSFSTKTSIPWKLIYAEVYRSRKDAEDRERKLKYYGRALAQLKMRTKRSFLEALKVRGLTSL